MKSIVYSGPFDEVEVPYVEDGRPKVFVAKRGEAAECPGELADRLLEQGDTWGEPKGESRKAKV